LDIVPAVKCTLKDFEKNSMAYRKFKEKRGDPFYFCPSKSEDVELEGSSSHGGMI
jgi:hypothetical protein